jgi:hypothetical protein
MGMINAVNSLRYDMHGRKRKTSSLSKPKKSHSFKSSRSYEAPSRAPEPSYMSDLRNLKSKLLQPKESEERKLERIREEKAYREERLKISSNYAIAPAYNKGAYQVIPKSDLKYIGKK